MMTTSYHLLTDRGILVDEEIIDEDSSVICDDSKESAGVTGPSNITDLSSN